MNFLSFLTNQSKLELADSTENAGSLFANGRFPERSATVFSSDLVTWAEFLATPYEPPANPVFDGFLEFESNDRLRWHGATPMAQQWERILAESFAEIWQRAQESDLLLEVLRSMLWRGKSGEKRIRLVSEPRLPCMAVRWNRQNSPGETTILLNPTLLLEVEGETRQLHPAGNTNEYFGILWVFWRRVLVLLAYPERPRDRFMERIEHTLEAATLSLHFLYKDKKENGRLVPTKAGARFQAIENRLQKMQTSTVGQLASYTHMVEDLSFLRGKRIGRQEMELGKVIVRDYLDPLYLRLSTADLMPASVEWMRSLALPKHFSKGKTLPPVPPLGKCGILDSEDQEAWKKLSAPMLDMGFYFLGQLGMGQFGRVYRAWNFGHSSLPPLVAIKVDRIRKLSRKEAILAAGTIMDIGRSLAASPHVIRIFDAGNIRKKNWTYHVLQLVEGDTLDNLIGTTGMEHASILRPEKHHASEDVVREELFKSVKGSAGESWRRARFSSEFSYPPSLLQTLDLMTSKSLWIEEVHRLGFAVNDLKNGNIMINRRGQFKGIDLDSYAPIASSLDKLPDFFFLAISTFHLVTHRCKTPEKNDRTRMTELLSDPSVMRKFLKENWPWPYEEGHREIVEEILGLLVDYIDSCRSGAFAREEGSFGKSIDKLIDLKRAMSNEDLVLE